MSNENDENTIQNEGVDSGYGQITRSGAAAEEKTETEVSTEADASSTSPDTEPQLESNVEPNDTEVSLESTKDQPTPTPPSEPVDGTPLSSVSNPLYTDYTEGDIDWESITNNENLAAHAESVAENASPVPSGQKSYDLIPRYDNPMATYLSARPSSIRNYKKQVNVSVRPELEELLDAAFNAVEDEFPSEKVNRADFFEMLLVRGLLSYDDTVGLMALHGHGMDE